MNETCQLWTCLSTRTLVELTQYQWRHYGTKLDIILGDQEYSEQFFVEALEEIDRIMRQPPSRSRGKRG